MLQSVSPAVRVERLPLTELGPPGSYQKKRKTSLFGIPAEDVEKKAKSWVLILEV